jgi:hypothetical protein
MFSNHVYKIIILPTLVIRIPNLEIFLELREVTHLLRKYTL